MASKRPKSVPVRSSRRQTSVGSARSSSGDKAMGGDTASFRHPHSTQNIGGRSKSAGPGRRSSSRLSGWYMFLKYWSCRGRHESTGSSTLSRHSLLNTVFIFFVWLVPLRARLRLLRNACFKCFLHARKFFVMFCHTVTSFKEVDNLSLGLPEHHHLCALHPGS